MVADQDQQHLPDVSSLHVLTASPLARRLLRRHWQPGAINPGQPERLQRRLMQPASGRFSIVQRLSDRIPVEGRPKAAAEHVYTQPQLQIPAEPTAPPTISSGSKAMQQSAFAPNNTSERFRLRRKPRQHSGSDAQKAISASADASPQNIHAAEIKPESNASPATDKPAKGTFVLRRQPLPANLGREAGPAARSSAASTMLQQTPQTAIPTSTKPADMSVPASAPVQAKTLSAETFPASSQKQTVAGTASAPNLVLRRLDGSSSGATSLRNALSGVAASGDAFQASKGTAQADPNPAHPLTAELKPRGHQLSTARTLQLLRVSQELPRASSHKHNAEHASASQVHQTNPGQRVAVSESNTIVQPAAIVWRKAQTEILSRMSAEAVPQSGYPIGSGSELVSGLSVSPGRLSRAPLSQRPGRVNVLAPGIAVRQPEAGLQSESEPLEPDVQSIAEQLNRMMQRDLVVARERRGMR